MGRDSCTKKRYVLIPPSIYRRPASLRAVEREEFAALVIWLRKREEKGQVSQCKLLRTGPSLCHPDRWGLATSSGEVARPIHKCNRTAHEESCLVCVTKLSAHPPDTRNIFGTAGRVRAMMHFPLGSFLSLHHYPPKMIKGGILAGKPGIQVAALRGNDVRRFCTR